MYDVAITLNDWTPMRAAMQQSPEIVVSELKAAMYEAEQYLEREVKENTPVGAQGFLRQSVFSETPQLLGDTVLGVVGSPLRYAESVELGTKPHWAPIQPLIDWVEQKLNISPDESEGVARRIQYKIAHKGTTGAFMFKTAFDRGQDTVNRIFEAAQGRIVQRLAGQA